MFLRFELDSVRQESLGVFQDYNKLCDTLEQTFKQVSRSPISTDEEGNVLYFQKVAKQGQEVLSLAKLKTLEYRLFRKMREKLRNAYGV